jgi:hypothetical protein
LQVQVQAEKKVRKEEAAEREGGREWT